MVTAKMTKPLFENTRRLSVFDKVDAIKKLINEHLPELKDNQLVFMMAHCREFYEGNLYYGRRTSNPEEKWRRPLRVLTKIESELLQLLLAHQVNPSTAYRWFLAARVPEDIMNEVKRKGMTITKAMEIARNRKRVKENKQGWQMISMIREIVRWL